MELLDTIKENIFPIISILIGITGLTFGIVSQRRNRSEKKPTYLIKTSNVFKKPVFNDLKISYKGNEIEDLYVSKVLFTNEGNTPIKKTDVHPDFPVHILIPNGVIVYDFDIIFHTKKSNGLKLKPTFDGFNLTFDYLNKSDGCIIQLMHSKLEYENNIEILGEIIGVQKIQLSKKNATNTLIDLLTVVFFLLPLLMASFLFWPLLTVWWLGNSLYGLGYLIILLLIQILSIKKENKRTSEVLRVLFFGPFYLLLFFASKAFNYNPFDDEKDTNPLIVKLFE